METRGTNLHGKLVEGHIARGVRYTMQLVPNINSLQALGNLCFQKHEDWLEAFSRFGVIQMQSSDGHEQKKEVRRGNK